MVRSIGNTGLVAPATGVAIAAAVGFGLGLSQTMLGIFGILLVPIATDFGWPRALVAGVMSLVVVKALALTLLVGTLVDRFGPRRVLLSALTLYAIGLIVFATLPGEVTIFYAGFGLICALGAPMAGPTLAKALAGWFDRDRGAAIGLSAGLGTGIGSAVFPVVAGSALPSLGWRGVVMLIAAIILLLGVPVVFALFRDPPPREVERGAAEGLTLTQVLHTPAFWGLMLSVGICAGCMTAMFTQVVPITLSNGMAMGEAVTAVSTFALVCAGAQWAIGMLIDRFQRPAVLVPFYLVGIAGLWLLASSTTVPSLLAAAVMMGVCLGAEYSALPVLLSRWFGLVHFGKVSALAYGIVAVVSGFIPAGLNAVFDATGSYRPAIDAMQMVMLIATLAIVPLPARIARAPRKVAAAALYRA
ncbi:MFS transporter [Sphingomonas sp. BK235]|uniref:MFS transporter n=1 Tax=Sphingomonas sp. BK235 TaxID=2512131 RepID=UPI0010505752|nr:MFS transporter [Sphingomonas sp. BK235]TCP29890.1 cyanate permease [Sphingomonas sp. BK235]